MSRQDPQPTVGDLVVRFWPGWGPVPVGWTKTADGHHIWKIWTGGETPLHVVAAILRPREVA